VPPTASTSSNNPPVQPRLTRRCPFGRSGATNCTPSGSRLQPTIAR
jgi:hypothetical protein